MGGDGHDTQNVIIEDEMSSYQTVFPSKDGRYLHVGFFYYDDNKQKLPEKYWNPRYGTKTKLNFKYNLYYVKIDLKTQKVKNFDGEPVKTPVSMETANSQCMIWDTDWRGSGVPPDIILDQNEHPAFLHILSEDSPDRFNYYYVRHVDGGWKQAVITPSNHKWNSSHLSLDKRGTLHAYLIGGREKYRTPSGEMDRYGGGSIEEWISSDNGNKWTKLRDLMSNDPEYAGWKFNNIQPIKDAKGNIKDGMLLFYGWKNSELAKAKAFLIVE